jgi:hypothetical protein
MARWYCAYRLLAEPPRLPPREPQGMVRGLAAMAGEYAAASRSAVLLERRLVQAGKGVQRRWLRSYGLTLCVTRDGPRASPAAHRREICRDCVLTTMPWPLAGPCTCSWAWQPIGC